MGWPNLVRHRLWEPAIPGSSPGPATNPSILVKEAPLDRRQFLGGSMALVAAGVFAPKQFKGPKQPMPALEDIKLPDPVDPLPRRFCCSSFGLLTADGVPVEGIEVAQHDGGYTFSYCDV